MRILVVEDSRTLIKRLTQDIEAINHVAIPVTSGEEALQYLEQNTVDMIFMDIEMPGLDGLETTRLIRESQEEWIPIIFVSGKTEDDDYNEGIEAGGDDYLIKPVSRIIIQAKIKAMERILSMQQQLNKLYAELESLHRFDSLTQIYNRRAFTEHAMEVWSLMARQHRSIAVLMLDLDHFKEYNDHYGHPAGDTCLQKVSAAIKDVLQRSGDLFGRYGGEEFIVVLANTNIKGTLKVSEDIRRAVESLKIAHTNSSTSDYVTVSIGGSVTPHSNDHSLEDVIKHADTALYKAKKHGRNQVCVEEFLFRIHKNVLVLDANSDMLLALNNILKDRCQIVTADNCEECLELIDAVKPEIIFINNQSPEFPNSEQYRNLVFKMAEQEIPLIQLQAEEANKLVKGDHNEGHFIDEQSLKAKIARYFP